MNDRLLQNLLSRTCTDRHASVGRWSVPGAKHSWRRSSTVEQKDTSGGRFVGPSTHPLLSYCLSNPLARRPTTSAVRRTDRQTMIANPDWDVYTERAFYASAPRTRRLLVLLLLPATNYPSLSPTNGVIAGRGHHQSIIAAHIRGCWKGNLYMHTPPTRTVNIWTYGLRWTILLLKCSLGRGTTGRHATVVKPFNLTSEIWMCVYTRSNHQRSLGTFCSHRATRGVGHSRTIIFIERQVARPLSYLCVDLLIQLTADGLCAGRKLIYDFNNRLYTAAIDIYRPITL